MQETEQYILLDINFKLEYEVLDQSAAFACEDSLSEAENTVPPITYDDDRIPMGTTVEEIKIRQKIIFQFYENWKKEHPEKAVYNRNLRTDILIRNESIVEAAAHASKRYKSTLAVLRLEELLANAAVIDTDTPKQGNKNQKKLIKMILMSYNIAGIGIIKLTVGVRRRSLEKVQYGITAIENGGPITPINKKNRSLKKHPTNK